MDIDIIIKVVIPILGAIITYMIVPFIMQKTNKEQREDVVAWVKIAVAAAEQMDDAGLITVPKKDYVVQFMKDKGIDVSCEDLDAIIEAAVKELNMGMNK